MNIALINEETNVCKNVAVFEDIETATNMFSDIYIVVEAESEYHIGDLCKDGTWTKSRQIQELSNAEKLEQESETMLYKEDDTGLLTSENQAITAGTSNKKWLGIPQKVANFLKNH